MARNNDQDKSSTTGSDDDERRSGKELIKVYYQDQTTDKDNDNSHPGEWEFVYNSTTGNLDEQPAPPPPPKTKGQRRTNMKAPGPEGLDYTRIFTIIRANGDKFVWDPDENMWFRHSKSRNTFIMWGPTLELNRGLQLGDDSDSYPPGRSGRDRRSRGGRTDSRRNRAPPSPSPPPPPRRRSRHAGKSTRAYDDYPDKPTTAYEYYDKPRGRPGPGPSLVPDDYYYTSDYDCPRRSRTRDRSRPPPPPPQTDTKIELEMTREEIRVRKQWQNDLDKQKELERERRSHDLGLGYEDVSGSGLGAPGGPSSFMFRHVKTPDPYKNVHKWLDQRNIESHKKGYHTR